MRTTCTAVLVILLAAFPVSARQSVPQFYGHEPFVTASPGAMKYGLYGYDNPALLTYVHQPDLYLTWTDRNGSSGDFNRWGIFAAAPNLGFGMIRLKTPAGSVTDYRLSSSFGNRTFGAGFGYGWSGGATDVFGRERQITMGFLVRPLRHLSLGVAGQQTLRSRSRMLYTDLAIRPFGDERLALFGDFALQDPQRVRDGKWSAGVVVEALPGIRVFGRAFEGDVYTAGLSVNLRRTGVTVQRRVHGNGGDFQVYGVRVGAYDRNVMDSHVRKERDYLDMNLLGHLRYQRFRLFDDSNTLLDVVGAVDEARRDPTVGGVALNLSGISASHEMKWELRERLRAFRETGKRVVIHLDRGGITDYHLASVADLLILDPLGNITLEGFISGNTYLRGLLEKIGIAAEEWRFFDYKSAFESIAREDMSEADREQRRRLIDHFYELVRKDVTQSRGISGEEFDWIVDEVGLLPAGQAREHGLVDTLGRWDDVREIIAAFEGRKKGFVPRGMLNERQQPADGRWGEPPRIAVIYALGICAMDEGIHARKLVKDVQRAGRDGRVKAIVLRVDSPGGDALASDLISRALKKAMEKKPVIVSQGAVAASGGYWLSMRSSRIVAAPNTITGSIGVIGGWLYDDGFKENLGLRTDFVKRGAFADLGFGATLPILNARLPDRNLTESEHEIMRTQILSLYDEFVRYVAEGRGMDYEEVEPHARGRIWSGWDGLDAGLVDEIGGLADALRIARQEAGIAPEEGVTIVEYPAPQWFDAGVFMPRLFGVEIRKTDPLVEEVLFRLRQNGLPMPLLPLESVPVE